MSFNAVKWARKVRGLKSAQRDVLMCLCDHYNPAYGCFPAQSTIATECTMSRRSVNNHLDTLEAMGLIARQDSVDPQTAQQRPTRYYIAFESDFQAKLKASLTVDKLLRRAQNLHTGPCAKNDESRVQNLHTNLVNKINNTARATSGDAGPVDRPMWQGDPELRAAMVAHPQYGLSFAVGYLDRAVVGDGGVIVARTHIGASRLEACLKVLGVVDIRVTGPPSSAIRSSSELLAVQDGVKQ